MRRPMKMTERRQRALAAAEAKINELAKLPLSIIDHRMRMARQRLSNAFLNPSSAPMAPNEVGLVRHDIALLATAKLRRLQQLAQRPR
ncbi:MAG: hypothetical protein AB7G06_02270 [Bdellovibrionales bacterium]